MENEEGRVGKKGARWFAGCQRQMFVYSQSAFENAMKEKKKTRERAEMLQWLRAGLLHERVAT